ncbi:hypothetical protein DXG03_003849 [Asterophora parasitica]|uniref:Mif2/CENP-C cupin domain-containing protein n=1 Tax=Asterophora parasitica TaxID=117018 RepID=A0A9P7FXH2_9AGAR|nr:hypothetical protein DXG03_003849 [Asterophora parasitica]
MFYVIEGAVNLKVHETSLVLATGAMFLVPRGNVYFIENISERDAKLFFAQARQHADPRQGAGSHIAPPRRSSVAQSRPASAAPGSARDKATPAPRREASKS